MATAHQNLQIQKFKEINLSDPFFDSLKNDYAEFSDWFSKKGESQAYLFKTDDGWLEGFLYLKIEEGLDNDIHPSLPMAKRLKIGTFKINPHGTRLGERFLKRAFDMATSNYVNSLYVTVFEKHSALVELFLKYGFQKIGTKITNNGTESVFERRIDVISGDVVLDYPRIPLQKDRHFLLSIYPQWHSRLLPDSLLATESSSILQDVSHTNSIHKIYLTSMSGVSNLRRGDTLLIYRTQDGGAAYYTSVVTSICVVEDLLHISRFTTELDFKEYCQPYSVFNNIELTKFYKEKRYPWLIRFTYNIALTKRLNRKILIEKVGLPTNKYWGFLQISTENFKTIVKLSDDYEKTRSIVHPS